VLDEFTLCNSLPTFELNQWRNKKLLARERLNRTEKIESDKVRMLRKDK